MLLELWRAKKFSAKKAQSVVGDTVKIIYLYRVIDRHQPIDYTKRYTMDIRPSIYRIALVSMVVASLLSCNAQKGKKQGEHALRVSRDELYADSAMAANMQSLKQIFYSMPSPLETALILKRAGAGYNGSLLNSIDNVSRYTTIRSMALNLGIYSTDLSYASLFDQTQTTISYMAATKKMAEGLGILNAIDEQTIRHLEENVNNRDVIMETISETFLNTNSILEEDDRVAVGSIILVGGWVEGLYIATSLVADPTKADKEFVCRIIDQKFSIESVIKLLEQNSSNEDVKAVFDDVLEIKQVFDQMQIVTSDIEIIPDSSTNVTTLRAQNTTTVNPTLFAELKRRVATMRTKYTS